MKPEEIIGKLYLFKLQPDYTIARVELNLIGKNSSYFVTRDVDTNKKNSYPISDLQLYKSRRVLLEVDDFYTAKDIISKGLFKKMLDAQYKATETLDAFTKFKEVNRCEK